MQPLLIHTLLLYQQLKTHHLFKIKVVKQSPLAGLVGLILDFQQVHLPNVTPTTVVKLPSDLCLVIVVLPLISQLTAILEMALDLNFHYISPPDTSAMEALPLDDPIQFSSMVEMLDFKQQSPHLLIK